MTQSLIHLSDLHYVAGQPENYDKVLKALFDDLSNIVSDPSTAVFAFNGDAVYSGDESETYSKLGNLLDQKLNNLNISRDRRFLVPGNHDISRGTLKEQLFIHLPAVDQLSSEDQFNSRLKVLETNVLSQHFSNYKSFESIVTEKTCCHRSIFGSGWPLSDEIGIYCLNSAACSAAGLASKSNPERTDFGKLHVATRHLYEWLDETDYSFRILLMHHPFEWFSEWSRRELRSICRDHFQLVLTGHTHINDATHLLQANGEYLHLAAPALFTRKDELLGYTIIDIDTDTHAVNASYRSLSTTGRFVAGSHLSGTDNGKLSLRSPSSKFAVPSTTSAAIEIAVVANRSDTSEKFQKELDNALYLTRTDDNPWVDREFSPLSENHEAASRAKRLELEDVLKRGKRCIIRGYIQSGLTCVAKQDCYKRALDEANSSYGIVYDISIPKPNHKSHTAYIDQRLQHFGLTRDDISIVYIDNWSGTKHDRKLLQLVESEFAERHIVVLQNIDEWMEIDPSVDLFKEDAEPALVYLLSLSRSRVRDLVSAAASADCSVGSLQLSEKVLSCLEGMNAHRSPLNCLLMLRLLENDDEEAPVNRYELIDKTLSLLFYEFEDFPSYADRPDIKDCIFALGSFCESLFRENRTDFDKREFSKHIRDVCDSHLLQIDTDILFTILIDSRIIMAYDGVFRFRFLYWYFYFMSHRMRHSSEFAKFVFENQRYSSHPEIMEYYTAIDRQRDDAIQVLIDGLIELNAGFTNLTRIPIDFNPYEQALWRPAEDTVARMRESLSSGLAAAALPQTVKDALADSNYDPARPYRQDVSAFIEESTIHKLVSAARAAARSLRNSDFVSPDLKLQLLDQVFLSWVRMCQVIAIISPLLAKQKTATFQDTMFVYESFDEDRTEEQRWMAIMSAILDNVVGYFHEDLFSKKLGPLVMRYVANAEGEIATTMALLTLVKHRPKDWHKAVDSFIIRSNKNSVHLANVMNSALHEVRAGTVSERNRSKLLKLASKALAKHETGSKDPGIKLVDRARRAIEESNAEEQESNDI